MNYQQYTPEDFLMDDSFLHYCMGDDQEAIHFWETWLEQYPEKLPGINEAKRLFAIINGHQGNLKAEVDRFRRLFDQHIQQQLQTNMNEYVEDRTAGEMGKIRNLYRRWWRVAAAAVIILGIGATVWYRYAGQQSATEEIAKNEKSWQNVKPGSSKAQLKLADGSIVTLDSVQTTQLKEKDGTIIDKGQGKLVYDDASSKGEEILFNTLSTPRGGEYQLVLPDGSKVWLNAASSLRFPTKFGGKERKVFLTGEAYFEVAKNAKQPFKVSVNEMEVEVLGTHFNVMAYDDENTMKTTLVEGKVKVSQAANSVQVLPYQQAILKKNSRSLSVDDADVEEAIAWKNGLFQFNENDILSIMRQLSRWYDVEVSFSGQIPQGHYSGSIRRQSNISQVLAMLELPGGVQFTIEGKKVVVKAK